jgi:hypothetical protein
MRTSQVSRPRSCRPLPFAAAALGLALAWSAPASAQNECELPPDALVVTGSNELEPFAMALSAQFHAAKSGAIFYVEQVTPCRAVQQVMQQANLGSLFARFLDYKMLSGGQALCALPLTAHADVWVSDQPIESCFNGEKQPEYPDFLGPITALSLVVPVDSPAHSITMEEAYFVFGFGTAGYKGQTVAPWKDQGRFAFPSDGWVTRSLWAKFMHLPGAAAMKVLDVGGAERVGPFLALPAAVHDGAIGPVSAPLYNTGNPPLRSTVKALAIRDWQQVRAFYPDATPASFEKRNVRDGHYPFWTRVHLGGKLDGSGKVAKPLARAFVDAAAGQSPAGGTGDIDAMIKGYVVPPCAMRVQRSSPAGELTPYAPPAGTACGCYMDEAISAHGSGCAACDQDAPCADGKTCSHGFCE